MSKVIVLHPVYRTVHEVDSCALNPDVTFSADSER